MPTVFTHLPDFYHGAIPSPCLENSWYDIFMTFGIRCQDLVKNLKLLPENIAKFLLPETPPWTLSPLNINLEIAHAK